MGQPVPALPLTLKAKKGAASPIIKIISVGNIPGPPTCRTGTLPLILDAHPNLMYDVREAPGGLYAG